MKRITAVFILLFIMCLLVGCSCRHEWEDATCTKPQTCSVCGATEGTANGHSYGSDGECWDCGEVDPKYTEMLAKCSLSVPTLPQTFSYKDYNGVRSSVEITGISYEFNCDYPDGTIGLTVKFSGKKTYDYKGNYHSDSCYIGWKLYDPSGNVVDDGTFYTPSLAVGESFSNQEVDVLYSWDGYTPGAYSLSLSGVDW